MNKVRAGIPLLIISLCIVWGVTLLMPFHGMAWETKSPELAKKWEQVVGFKAVDKVGHVAPEITPGLVIDARNYKSFEGLKQLMPTSLYNRFDPSCYAPLAPLRISGTDQYHLSTGWLDATIKNMETCRLAEDNITLLGYNGGIPFIHPRSGNELIQWVDHFYAGDSLAFRPMRMILYGRANKFERELRQELNNLVYYGCTDWRKDNGSANSEGIHHITSGLFIYPRDISGTSYVRRRYIDGNKPDEFLLYVASMRRIRRMSGTDTQDPLFGSDLVWDDYKYYWQKLSSKNFPNKYTMLPETEMLVPTYVDYDWPNDRIQAGYKDYNIDDSGDQTYLHFGSWQRRPVYPLEIVSMDPGYVYSKRVLYNDLEIGTQVYSEMYDRSGRLWRTFLMNNNLAADSDGMMWDYADIVDQINKHRTILDFKGQRNPTWLGPEFADLRFLSRKAK